MRDLPAIVCVPARNEGRSLPALLTGLAAFAEERFPPSICIYLDSCDDESRDVVSRLKPSFPLPLMVGESVIAGEPNAGSARSSALALGIDLLGDREGLLFTTDADSIPRTNWLQAGRHALSVADVVAGGIARDRGQDDALQSRVERYYNRLYRYRRFLDPVPWEAEDPHHFGGGANIAVLASTYRALGGFKSLPSGEDAAFLDDAARAGYRVRRDPAMSVVTSSRRTGRADGGLASSLRRFDEGLEPFVGDPRGAGWQWRRQAEARRAFSSIDVAAVRSYLGGRIGLTADHVLGVARDCPNGEAFAMRVVPKSPIANRDLLLSEAECLLDTLIAVEREIAA